MIIVETSVFTRQVLSLLSDDGWRSDMMPYFSPLSRAFWKSRFPRLPAEAITPVTNLLDRLRSSTGVSALLGASRSTYDIRRAMDRSSTRFPEPKASR